ncbi:MAG: TolC family protein [Verrucomicrobiota bacterium]
MYSCVLRKVPQMEGKSIKFILVTVLTASMLQGGSILAQQNASPANVGLGTVDKPYRLVDCINVALQKNPIILEAEQKLEEQKGLVISAKALLYPKLNLSSRLEMENDDLFEDQVVGSSPRERFREDWNIELVVSHSLYSGGVNRNTVAISEMQKEIAFIEYQETINDEILNVKQSFYEVLLHSGEAKIQREIIDLLSQELLKQKRLFEAGRASKFDIVRTEVRLANEKPDYIEARTRLQIAAINLAEVMGLAWAGGSDKLPLKVTGMFTCPRLNYKLDELIERALSKRPEPLRFSKHIQIEERNENIARASNIPRLDTFVRGRLERDRSGNSNNNFFDNKTELSCGLLGVWNIFDGFRGKGEAKAAEARRKGFEVQLDDANRTIEFDVRRAHLRLQQAESSVKSQAGNVEKAREALRLVNVSVEAGRNNLFDVLQATVDLNRAQTTELRSRFAYHQSLAELEQATFSRKLLVSQQSIVDKTQSANAQSTQTNSP